MFAESKVAVSFDLDGLFAQFKKHIQTKVLTHVDDMEKGWKSKTPPLLHCELRGSAFTKENVARMNEKFSKWLKSSEPDAKKLKKVKPAFIFDSSSFNDIDELLHPLVN